MNQRDFWTGFGWGALAGAGLGLGTYAALLGGASSNDLRILRIEKSIEIGRPKEEVFQAWQDLENLPNLVDFVRSVRRSGAHSRWVLEFDGRVSEFDAETTQVIPNEAIGWKSVRGPKHSGRIHFAQLGSDTLVVVTMNYAPPLGRFSRALAPATAHLESVIERVLRDFKAALEGKEGRVQRRRDHHFSVSSPHKAEDRGRRDLLEASGARLEEIRGGTQRFDRRKIEGDRDAVYSPTNQTNYGNQGPNSAGWDEAPKRESQIPQAATGTHGTSSAEIARRAAEEANPVEFTRPTEDRYPSGVTQREREGK
jgi:uncharacterized membrane protein